MPASFLSLTDVSTLHQLPRRTVFSVVREESSLLTPLLPQRPSKPSHLLHRNLAASTADATSFGVMVGVGETFLPAFALAVGLGEVTAGLVASVPLMAGGLIQLVTPWFLARYSNRQAWIVGSATFQALAFLPLVIAAWIGSISTWGLLLIASVYWAGGLATGPAWNTWIEQIVPRRVRAKYFARRTRAAQLATLFGFVGGGLLLQFGRTAGWLTTAFAILFAVAFVFRIISAALLAAHRVPAVRPATIAAIAPESSADKLNGRQLLMYLVIVQGMVQISGPYFTPYMLKQMDLSYFVYTGLIAVAFVAKVISLAAWGAVAKERGAAWLLTVGGIAIVPLASLWTVSQSIYWLVFIQTINGIAWAAYELGFFLMFFEALPQARRVKMLTYYNFANTTSWCMGSSLGAIVLYSYGASLQGYYMLFTLSSIGRGLALVYLLMHRPAFTARVTQIGFRIMGVRPSAVPLETPILSSVPEDKLAVASTYVEEDSKASAA
jgi:MFS family permease